MTQEMLELIPIEALSVIYRVMFDALDRYGRDHYKSLPVQEHLDHALAHGLAVRFDQETCEDDLAHAATRMLLALAVREQQLCTDFCEMVED